MTLEKKLETIAQFKTHEGDTGSTEVQVALLTRRIQHLVEHLKKNNKDNHSRRGLLLLVGQRKRLLNYLKREDTKRFDVLTGSLKLQ
ncbi:MAG: 30S ribosomal protein S15 [Candidatus Margulisiibacteriota bacterium]